MRIFNEIEATDQWADVASYVIGGRFAEPGRADVRPLRQRGTQESAPINRPDE